MFLMCPEKVESDCSMDCSSPISANRLLKMLKEEPERAGMCSPDWAISAISPTVFKRDGFAAGVRPGDDHPEGLLIQVDVDRHHGRRVEQGVARLVEAEVQPG